MSEVAAADALDTAGTAESVTELDVSEVDESWLSDTLESTPAGAELAALLATVERAGLDGDQLLTLARARNRLIAHQQAQLLADLHQVARTVPAVGDPPPAGGMVAKYPWAQVECAFALTWTTVKAGGELELADELIDRLPVVYAALAAGLVDRSKAVVFVNSLAGLDDAAARGIAERVIGQAPGLTTGQLAARLRRLVLAEYPQVAAARARQEVKERRVAAYLGDNALASLAGYELAPHRVAAAMERLSGIAKAAKAAGDQRRLDQLRADVFLDLLVGDGVADGGPITSGDLPAGDHADPAAGSPTAPDVATPWPAAPADPLAHTMPEPTPAGHEPTPDTYGGPGGGGGRQARDGAQPRPEQPDPHESQEPQESADPQESQQWADPEAETLRELYYRGFGQLPTTRPNPGTGHPAGTSSQQPTIRPAPRRGVVDLQVPLTTLLRLTELPGELEGFGPVIADIARHVATQPQTQWRYSIYNKLGELVQHGITHARPQPRRRHPTAATTAHVRARDRTCRAPGCRRPARRCDLDHITPWAQHGDTHPGNLAALCPRHHAFKGTTGTELAQLGATLAWRTPTGRHYTTHPTRYHEPEHPLPPPDP